MAIGYDNIFTGASDAATTTVSSVAVGNNTNRILIALVGLGDHFTSSQVASIVFNSSEYFTYAGTQIGDGQDTSCEVWYLVNPTVTTANVVVDYTGSTTPDAGVAILSLYGVDQSDPIGATNTATAQSNSASVSLTTEAANSWIVDIVAADDNNNPGSEFSPTGSQTERVDFEGGSGTGTFTMAVGTRAVTTATSYTVSWSIASGTEYWVQEAVEVKAAAVTPTERTKTFTADGIVKEKNKTKTFTADGIISSGAEVYLDVDGIVKATQTKTFTADGIIINKTTITADGIITEVSSNITYDSGNNAGTDAASTTVSITVGSNDYRLLLVMVGLGNASTSSLVSTVKYNGTDLSRVTWVNDNVDSGAEIWYLVAPEVGTYNVVVTYDGEPDAGVVVLSLYGVDQTNPIGAYDTNQGSGAGVSSSLTTIYNSSWIVDVNAIDSSVVTMTPNSGQEERYDFVAGAGGGMFGMSVSTREVGQVGSYTNNWTASGSYNWVSAIVEVQTSNVTKTKNLTVDGIVKVTGVTKTFTTSGIVAVRNTKTFTGDAVITNQYYPTFTVDGLIFGTQTKTFTADGIIVSGPKVQFTVDGLIEYRKYVVGDASLPRPNYMKRETLRRFADLKGLDGSTARDYTNSKERIILGYDYLAADKMALILTEVNKGTPVEFSVFETNLEIDQVLVIPEINRYTYVKGGDYLHEVEIVLTRVS